MGFTDAAKNDALDAIAIDEIRLHSDDPGSAGTLNAVAGATHTDANLYAAAAAASRDLTAPVEVPVGAGSTVSHYSIWHTGTFKGGFDFVGDPEVYTNAGTATINSAPITLADA